MPSKALKFAIGVGVVIAAVSLVGDLSLGVRFSHAPVQPNPTTGQVIPYNIHGSTVYVTARDKALDDCLGALATGSIVITSILAFRLQKRKVRQP